MSVAPSASAIKSIRDAVRARLLYGDLGETYVPRSVILNYSLIPTEVLPSSAKALAFRANCLMDPYYLGSVVLKRTHFSKNPDRKKNLHYIMCLIVLKDGLKEGIEIPRDHLKSTVYSEVYPIFRALPFGTAEEDFFSSIGFSDLYIEWMRRVHSQDIRILIVSETIKNAIKLGGRIANHYENNDLFRQLFFDILPTEKETWTADSLHQRRTAAGRGHGEGTFDFIGVGAALQSRHYNLVIEDDMVGREARKSLIVMADIIDYHQILAGATDFDIDNPGKDFDELLVANRWGYDDLNSYVRREEPYFSWTTHSALGGCCSLHPFGEPIYPEGFTKEKLLRWKQRLGTYHFSCFGAGTLILMSDFSEKPIENLKLGDEIVGYTTEGYMSLAKARVEAVNVRKAIAIEVTTSSGRTFICTPDHKFLKRFHRDRGLYASLMDLDKGTVLDELMSVYTPCKDPTPEEQRDLDWLGGIFDGEGSCGVSGQCLISQSPTVNPLVDAEITATLDRLKIPWGYVNESKQITVQGGRGLKVRLLKHAKMAKRQRFIDSIWNRSGRVAEDGGFDKVSKITMIGEVDVYNIQSSTGNYVAAGFATKNCQFLNAPLDPAKKKFNIADFRYFNFERISGALAIPKEPKDIPWQHAKRLEIVHPQQYRTVIRHHVAEGDVEEDVFPRYLDRYIITDPNHSGEHPDNMLARGGRCRHAIIVVGIQHSPRRLYLLDQWAEACKIDRYVEKILFYAIKWKMKRIHCEEEGGQKFLIYHFNFYLQQNVKDHPDLEGMCMVSLKSSRAADAKQERIDNTIPMVERHEVWLDANNCSDFREEAEKYGQQRTTIDLLDCFGYIPQLAPVQVTSDDSIEEFLKKQRQKFTRGLASIA